MSTKQKYGHYVLWSAFSAPWDNWSGSFPILKTRARPPTTRKKTALKESAAWIEIRTVQNTEKTMYLILIWLFICYRHATSSCVWDRFAVVFWQLCFWDGKVVFKSWDNDMSKVGTLLVTTNRLKLDRRFRKSPIYRNMVLGRKYITIKKCTKFWFPDSYGDFWLARAVAVTLGYDPWSSFDI